MDKATKVQLIESIQERFDRAKAAFLVDFKGINVEQVTRLRKQLRPVKAEMKVVRNTLAVRALDKFPTSKEAISGDFVGTNAVVFAYDDAAAAARTLKDFAKDVEKLQLKAGLIGDRRIDAKQVEFLATLPPKDVLRAQLLGVLAAPATKFVRVLSAVPSGFVRVLNAQKTKLEG